MFLTKNYSTLGVQECSQKLGRTIDAIHSKVMTLGLTSGSKRLYVIETISKCWWTKFKYNANDRNLIFNITPSDVWQLFLDQDKKCLFCNDTISFDYPISGSIDRINNKIGYILDNIQLTCKQCNMMKQRNTNAELIEQSIKISNNFN